VTPGSCPCASSRNSDAAATARLWLRYSRKDWSSRRKVNSIVGAVSTIPDAAGGLWLVMVWLPD